MFAKEFTHKNGLYTAMHNVAHIYTQKKCVLTRKTHFVKSAIFYLKSVVLFKNN